MRKEIRGIFPGVFTMGNMLCGFLSIKQSFDGEAIHAAWFVLAAAFLDALDGKVARFSRSASRFGVEIDSFADFASFGIAPALIFYSFKLADLGMWGWMLGFIFVMCGAFRLARFNLQAKLEIKENFMGLPIPIAAFTICGYTLFCYKLWGELRFPEFLITMLVVFSALMVSNIEYETLPQLSLNPRKNVLKLILLFLAALAILIAPYYAIFPAGFLYVLSGLAKEGYRVVYFERKAENKKEESS
jgi:CDP-diacylglycerol--serine O-phosphatidyltransferase